MIAAAPRESRKAMWPSAAQRGAHPDTAAGARTFLSNAARICYQRRPGKPGQVIVPEGHMIIAQRFNACHYPHLFDSHISVPTGASETLGNKGFLGTALSNRSEW